MRKLLLPELINERCNADEAKHDQNDAFNVTPHSRHHKGSDPMMKISTTKVR